MRQEHTNLTKYRTEHNGIENSPERKLAGAFKVYC